MADSGDGRPVLWHLAMSHYNEKARWALDYKRVPHRRRAVMPGVHRVVAGRLSGGVTFPVLELDGVAIGESAEIVRRIDERFPEPPLYPADPALRALACELEQRFDTVLAPAMRQAVYQEMLEDREFAADFLSVGGSPLRRRVNHLALPALRPVLRSTFSVPDRDDPTPRNTVRAELEAIGSMVGGSGFLVGDSFTVADLAACSFLIPLVDMAAMPEAMPQLIDPLAEFGRELAGTPGGEWVASTYRRYRAVPV